MATKKGISIDVQTYSNTGVYSRYDCVYVDSGLNSGRYFTLYSDSSFSDINGFDYGTTPKWAGWYNFSSPAASIEEIFNFSYSQTESSAVTNSKIRLGEGYTKSINTKGFLDSQVSCKFDTATGKEAAALLLFSEIRNSSSGFYFRPDGAIGIADIYNIHGLKISEEYNDNFNLSFGLAKVFENNTDYRSNSPLVDVPLTGLRDLFDYTEIISGFDVASQGTVYNVDNSNYAVVLDICCRGTLGERSASNGETLPNSIFYTKNRVSSDISNGLIGGDLDISFSEGSGIFGNIFSFPSNPFDAIPYSFASGDYHATYDGVTFANDGNIYYYNGVGFYNIPDKDAETLNKSYNIGIVNHFITYVTGVFSTPYNFLPITTTRGEDPSDVYFFNYQQYWQQTYGKNFSLNKSSYYYINNIDLSKYVGVRLFSIGNDTENPTTKQYKYFIPQNLSFLAKIYRKNTLTSDVTDSTLVSTKYCRYYVDLNNLKKTFNVVFRIADVSDFSSVTQISVE